LIVAAAKTAFGKTQIINGIEQIGFTASVFTKNAGYVLFEIELLKPVIAKLSE
jgi:hypothetical protein